MGRKGEKEKEGSDLEGLEIEEVIEELDTDSERGLSQGEASRRLEQYGPNSIEEDEQSWIVRLLSHFWGPIPWMIEVAAILAAVAQRWEDFAVIFVMLLINGGVGFWHEKKAGDAIAALKERLSPTAQVIRQGESKTIDAWEVVPGDLVVLRMGDIVPADAELLADEDLSVDESALTGESLPVHKQESDAWHPGGGHAGGGLRSAGRAGGLGPGARRLGLCPGLAGVDRRREGGRLPPPRSGQGPQRGRAVRTGGQSG